MSFDFSKEPGKNLLNRYNVDYTEKPLISVITPFYNAGKYFEQTFNCVMNQTFPYFEWIIVNDGSTNEEDIKMLEHFASLDERIRVFHKENGGISTARNYGIKNSNCEILITLDADDLIIPTYFEYLYWALLKNEKATWAYCGLVGFSAKEHLWSIPFSSNSEKKENILVVSSAIRKKELLVAGSYNELEKHYNEDWHLWLRFLAKGYRPVQLKDYYGFWYRVSNSGVLAKVVNNEEISNRNKKIISEISRRVPNGILSIANAGKRTKELPIPNKSSWDKTLKYKSKKTNVLMLLPWTVVGGADKFNLEIVSRMDKNKYEISIITTLLCALEDSWKQRFEQHVTDIFDLAQFLAVEDYAEFIHYFIKSRSIDVLFLSNSYYGYYLLPWLRREFPSLIIVDFYHSEASYWRCGGYGRTTTAVDSCIDMTYVGDDLLRNQKIAKKEKTADKIKAIYIGVDEKEFDIKNADGKALKTKLNIDEGRPVVLFLARISHEKRPLLMVEIALETKKKIPNVAFIVVGDGECLEDVKAKSEEYNLKDTVYIAGRQKSAIECYAATDVTLLCSLKEGLALTTYESLSMGKPMISADIGGQSCLIDDAVGRLVPLMQEESQVFETSYSKEEAKLYANAIYDVLKDKEKYNQMSKNCREKILASFTVDGMIKNLDSEFTKLLSGKDDEERISVADACKKMGRQTEDYLALYCEWEYPKYIPPVSAEVTNYKGDLKHEIVEIEEVGNIFDISIQEEKPEVIAYSEYETIKIELDGIKSSTSFRMLRKMQKVADRVRGRK